MSAQEVWPEIGPHTTHLHLLDSLPEPHGNEAFLRDDQRAALEILSYEEANPRTPEIVTVITEDGEEKFTIANMLMNAHTRWGKFEVAMAFFNRYKQDNPESRGLYLAHTKGLIKDGREKFDRRWGDAFSAGEFHGGKKEFDEFDMLFSTFQTIRGEIGSRFSRRHFGFKIVDESHHSEAPTYKEVIQYFVPDVRLGITATPNRLDQLDIRRTYGQEVIDAPLAEGIVRGNLRPMTYKVMLEDTVKSLVEDAAPSVSDLNKVTARIDPNLKEMIKRGQKEIQTAEIRDPKVIHFAQSIQQAEDIACYLPNSSVIHSGQTDQENDEAIRRFREGEVDNVISINMLNEGIDLPSANVIAFYRSTESENIFIQQLGRGLEPAEDGSSLLVLDYVANAKRLEFIYNLMHGITNYALEATEYKQKSANETNERDYNEPDWVNVPRSLGAKFELDEELLKVVEAIAEQQEYIEKKKRFENLTEYEALAYVGMLGRRRVEKQNSVVNMPLGKSRLAEMSKRGLGPSYRGLLAATNMELVDMMNAVGYGFRKQYEINNAINELELPDAIILLAQDIAHRHPESETLLTNQSGLGLLLDKALDLTEFGLSWSMNEMDDMVVFTTDQGFSVEITPVWSHSSRYDKTPKSGCHGWDITIIRSDDDQVIAGQFFASDKGETSKEHNLTTARPFYYSTKVGDAEWEAAGLDPNKPHWAGAQMNVNDQLTELFAELCKTRIQLDARGELRDGYPFYAYRHADEVGAFLDDFSGVNENEWHHYADNRENIAKASPYVEKLREVIKIGSQVGFDWLDQKDGYEFIPLSDQEVGYDPITDVIMVTSRTNPNIALQFGLDDNRMRKIGSDVRILDMGIIFPTGKTSEHIDGFYNRVIELKNSKEHIFSSDEYFNDDREETLAYTHDWLEKFCDKVNATQGYINSDQLGDFTNFGDEAIGKFFKWVDPNNEDKNYWGTIKSVDYKKGTIQVFNRVVYLTKDRPYERDVTKTFKMVRRSKTGLFEPKPTLMGNLYIESVDL